MESYLKYINWSDRLKAFKGRNVALYGAGKYGKNALENIKKYLPQLEIVCFLDDNKIRNNKDIDGIKIYSLDEARKINDDFNILITNYYILPVLKKIELSGFDVNKVFFWNEILIEDVEYEFLLSHMKDIKEAYNYLNDYQSKKIFQTMIEARYTKNIDFLGRTFQKIQYFPDDIFSWGGANEVFVDGGAFDGDTMEQFLKHTNYQYRYIYAFEPDNTNYEKLIKKQNIENSLFYNGGLYNQTMKIGFTFNKGGSSKVKKEENSSVVQVYKFDDLKLPNDEITFIKMDIEGSELSALKGMEKTIKRCKPKLAICIYHKLEDLWELPLYIKQLVPDYKLYIRNYTSYLDEIVLYAVCKDSNGR